MRFPLAALCLIVCIGCDSSSSEVERVPQDVFVKAESVEFDGTALDENGRTEVFFNYVGSVEASCYGIRGYGYSDDGQRAMVTVTAQATAESCPRRPSTVRIRIGLSVFFSQPGSYTYAFDRREDAPIEVRVTLP